MTLCQRYSFGNAPVFIPVQDMETGIFESGVIFGGIDPCQTPAEIMEGGLRIRFIHHQPVEKLLFPVRPVEKEIHRNIGICQHDEYMAGI